MYRFCSALAAYALASTACTWSSRTTKASITRVRPRLTRRSRGRGLPSRMMRGRRAGARPGGGPGGRRGPGAAGAAGTRGPGGAGHAAARRFPGRHFRHLPGVVGGGCRRAARAGRPRVAAAGRRAGLVGSRRPRRRTSGARGGAGAGAGSGVADGRVARRGRAGARAARWPRPRDAPARCRRGRGRPGLPPGTMPSSRARRSSASGRGVGVHVPLERLLLVGEFVGLLLQLARAGTSPVERGVQQQQRDQPAAEQQHDQQDERGAGGRARRRPASAVRAGAARRLSAARPAAAHGTSSRMRCGARAAARGRRAGSRRPLPRWAVRHRGSAA